MNATETPDILQRLAGRVWGKNHDGAECPAEAIPTEAALADWLQYAPTKAHDEATERLTGLFASETKTVEFHDLDPQKFRWRWVALPQKGDQFGFFAYLVHHNPSRHLIVVKFGPLSVAEAQEKWRHFPDNSKPPHPLAPIVEAWQNRPREVESNDRPDPLFPSQIIIVKSDDSRATKFFSPANVRPTNKGGTTYFPGFAPGEEHGGPITPALPVQLYDLGLGKENKLDRAAPLALRMFVEACLSVPQDERKINKAVLLPPERLSHYLLRLYPDGAKNWRRKKDLGALLEAFEALESPEARIHWEGPDGTGGARRVVIPRDIPRNGKMDDWVQFAVDLPPSSDRGPLIDRPALIRAGASSAAQYRLILGLSFWWFSPGRLQRPVANGGPWVLPRDGQRYPEVSDELLVAMTFPTGDATADGYRQRLHRAKQFLDKLITTGFAGVAPKRRIYPGLKWAGWGNRELPE